MPCLLAQGLADELLATPLPGEHDGTSQVGLWFWPLSSKPHTLPSPAVSAAASVRKRLLTISSPGFLGHSLVLGAFGIKLIIAFWCFKGFFLFC